MRGNAYVHWGDAQRTADFRASLTRYVYRVRWDAANGLWSITETTEPVRQKGRV